MTVFKRPNVEAQVVDIDIATHAGKTVDVAAFPVGTIITDVRVVTTSAFTAGCTAAVAMGATSVVASGSVDNVGELKSTQYHMAATGKTKLSLTMGAATSGAGYVCVSYILPTKLEVDY